jgi:hypothetical protein
MRPARFALALTRLDDARLHVLIGLVGLLALHFLLD